MTKKLIPADTTSTTPLTIRATDFEKFVGSHIPNHVKTGYTVTNGGGLNAVVAVGVAYLFGLHVETDAAITIAIANNTTNYLYIQVVRTGGGEATDWNIVSNTTGITPADAYLIATVVTSGGSITTITDKRQVKAASDRMILPVISAPSFAGDIASSIVLYAKQIDSNNIGLFALIKKAGSVVEVQVA